MKNSTLPKLPPFPILIILSDQGRMLFLNILNVYSVRLLASCLNLKLQRQPLLAVRDFLFHIFPTW